LHDFISIDDKEALGSLRILHKSVVVNSVFLNTRDNDPAKFGAELQYVRYEIIEDDWNRPKSLFISLLELSVIVD